MVRYTRTVTLLVTLFFLATNSYAAKSDYPKLKAGEWEMSTDTSGVAGVPKGMMDKMKVIMCVDEASQEEMFRQSEKDMDECNEPTITKSGSNYDYKVTCKHEGKEMMINSKVTFQGDEKFVTNTSIQGKGVPAMKASTTSVYKGECRAGLKPGDTKVLGMPDFGKMAGQMMQDPEMMKQMQEAMKQIANGAGSAQ